MVKRFRRILVSVAALAVAIAVSVGTLAQGSRNTHSLLAGQELSVGCQAGLIYVTPDGASRIVGCSSAATSTATVVLPTGSATATVSSTATATATPAPTGWWLAGGVDPADVVGAWRAKGASSYAASLVNLNGGPGLYAPHYSPMWSQSIGWQGDQEARLQITGGVSVTYGWSYVMKVANAAQVSQQFMGCRRVWNDWTTGMDLNNTGGFQHIESFNAVATNPLVINGTMALAGPEYYVNGVHRASMTPNPGASCGFADLMIMTMSWGHNPHGGNIQTEVQGVAVYSDTLTAGQAAAIATAVSSW